MRGLAALGMVIVGAVAAFAVYTLGWHDDDGGGRGASDDRAHHVYILTQGDVVRIPGAAARCEVSHEAGIPNLFCAHTGRTRYQAILWKDRADLYDLTRNGEPMVPTYSVPSLRAPSSTIRALTVVRATTPRFHVRNYRTSGAYPNVRGAPGLERANAALRRVVIADQHGYAPSARRYAGYPSGPGIYKTSIDRRLTSASTVVVSALIPALKLYPGGNDGQMWISTTVIVSSGEAVSLQELLRNPARALPVLAREWKAQARKTKLWGAVAEDPRSYTPTLRHYRNYALTATGLAFGFAQEPASSRLAAVIPYRLVKPYLSPLGIRLVNGVRRPLGGS